MDFDLTNNLLHTTVTSISDHLGPTCAYNVMDESNRERWALLLIKRLGRSNKVTGCSKKLTFLLAGLEAHISITF